MISFLSNADWLAPQLDFLLWLQSIRIEQLDKLFLSITILGETWLPVLICAVIYWCVDTKAGIYLFSLFGGQLFAGQVLKMIACVYRPWVLDDRIHPVKEAIAAAKGYSFPSGHSMCASSVLGGLIYLYKKHKILSAVLTALILCVGYSRLRLGVHTPQDVITGLFTGLMLVLILKPVIDWAENSKNRYLYLLAAVNLFAAAALVYFCYFKQYPLDYIDGKLLVNPVNSVYNFINCFGFAIGLINGAFLCRRFTSFDASKGSLHTKVIRGITGVLCIFIILKSVLSFVFSSILDFKYAFILTALSGCFVTLIFPMAITFIENLRAKK